MSNTGKTILWIVIILVVVGGGIWWWLASQNGGMNNNAAMTNGTSTMAAGTSSLPQGNSDQAINQEMTQVDAQMNGFNSDTASVNQSMSDQQVQQTNP